MIRPTQLGSTKPQSMRVALPVRHHFQGDVTYPQWFIYQVLLNFINTETSDYGHVHEANNLKYKIRSLEAYTSVSRFLIRHVSSRAIRRRGGRRDNCDCSSYSDGKSLYLNMHNH